MKVWLTEDTPLFKAFSHEQKVLPAGTSLLVSEEQQGLPPNTLRVYGATCYDIVSMDKLTLDSREVYEA